MDNGNVDSILRHLRNRVSDVLVIDRDAVCLPLSSKTEAGLVLPEAWSEYEPCRRQFSWYRQSEFLGRPLLITDIDLEALGLVPETIITKRKKFKPPRHPGPEDISLLKTLPAYREQRPDDWENIAAEDPADQVKWLKSLGLRDMTYGELFSVHCANHANFIDPHFFVREDGEIVPYSLERTNKVCSACMEFFNIIGRSSRRKLVVPCPGAALYAGMAASRYYEVLHP